MSRTRIAVLILLHVIALCILFATFFQKDEIKASIQIIQAWLLIHHAEFLEHKFKMESKHD